MGQRRLRGVPENGAVGAQHQRQVVGVGLVARDQTGRRLVRGGVEHRVRVAVARQEPHEPHRVGPRGVAHEHRAPGVGLDQLHPPQDQRAHDQLAQLCIGDQEPAQRLGRQQDRLDLAHRSPVHEGGLARELAHLGQELPRALGHHRHVAAQPVAPRHRDRAARHREEPRSGAARLEHELPVGVGARLAQGAQPPDLRGRQIGEGLVGPVAPGRRRRFLARRSCEALRESVIVFGHGVSRFRRVSRHSRSAGACDVASRFHVGPQAPPVGRRRGVATLRHSHELIRAFVAADEVACLGLRSMHHGGENDGFTF